METKICKKCKKEKELKEFYFRKKQNRYEYSCKECERKRLKQYYNYDKEKSNEYYKKNKNKILERRRKYEKRKRKEDEVFKLKMDLRTKTLHYFINKNDDYNLMKKIIGCGQKEFTNYLLNTFYINYGYKYNKNEKVNIDHIKPLKLAKTKEEVIEAFYYKNLQLLKEKDNIQKGTKIINDYNI